MKYIGKSHILQDSFLKKELEHDEIYEDKWEEKENEWLFYSKTDMLSTVFSYGRYSGGMENLTGFGLKNSLIFPSLANKCFNS